MIEIDIEIYESSRGKRPFEEWVKDIREVHMRAQILTRIDRLKIGNFGDCKTLQDGVCELKIHYGPGAYLSFFNNDLCALLASFCPLLLGHIDAIWLSSQIAKICSKSSQTSFVKE